MSIEELEQKLTTLHDTLLNIWSILRDTVPVHYAEDIDKLIDELTEETGLKPVKTIPLNNDGYYGVYDGLNSIAIYKLQGKDNVGVTKFAYSINLVGADTVYPKFVCKEKGTCEYRHVKQIILSIDDTKKLGIPIHSEVVHS